MSSGKQKRARLLARRRDRRERAAREKRMPPINPQRRSGSMLVNRLLLAAYSSYDVPEFVRDAYYYDHHFICRDCGVVQVWTAAQQQWWYETAKGGVFTRAVRCLNCRRAHRAARQKSLAGARSCAGAAYGGKGA